MRVISGEARGRRLKSVPGLAVRPTSDKVREALFSILGAQVPTGRFLDLYAGSGGVGIEALSRGAPQAVFVERQRTALQTLCSNLRLCGFERRATIVTSPVLEALDRPDMARKCFAVIFLDPPYDSDERETALRRLGERGGPMSPIVVVEHRSRNSPPEAAGILHLVRTVNYGDTALSFYARAGEI